MKELRLEPIAQSLPLDPPDASWHVSHLGMNKPSSTLTRPLKALIGGPLKEIIGEFIANFLANFLGHFSGFFWFFRGIFGVGRVGNSLVRWRSPFWPSMGPSSRFWSRFGGIWVFGLTLGFYFPEITMFFISKFMIVNHNVSCFKWWSFIEWYQYS